MKSLKVIPTHNALVKQLLPPEEEKLVALLANIVVDNTLKLSYEKKASSEISANQHGSTKQLQYRRPGNADTSLVRKK